MQFTAEDVFTALDKIGSRPRKEGETAFPEIAAIIAETRGIQVLRVRYMENAERDKSWEEYKAKAKREMDEDKADPVEWQAKIDAASQRLGMERKPKELDLAPKMQTCPWCTEELPIAANFRFWTTDEMRKYADELDAAKDRKRQAANS